MIPWAPSDEDLRSALAEGIDTIRGLTERLAPPGIGFDEARIFSVKIRRKLIALERYGIVRRAGEMKRNGIDRQYWRLTG